MDDKITKAELPSQKSMTGNANGEVGLKIACFCFASPFSQEKARDTHAPALKCRYGSYVRVRKLPRQFRKGILCTVSVQKAKCAYHKVPLISKWVNSVLYRFASC